MDMMEILTAQGDQEKPFACPTCAVRFTRQVRMAGSQMSVV